MDPSLLDIADRVCSALLRESERLESSDLMLVGAHCRDILQARQGHELPLRATDDVDIGLALSDWATFHDLSERLTRSGDSGIRFRVEGVPLDLMPFGPVEAPTGVVTPRPRDEPMSVWAFQEVFDRADALPLPTAGSIRIPTIPGYTALKLAAWLDRSPNGDYKDADDLAAAFHWYSETEAVVTRLYADKAGEAILLHYDVDPRRGASHLLGEDVADLIGPDRQRELSARWPGDRGSLLPAEMRLRSATTWPTAFALRLELLNAFEQGLGLGLTEIE